MVTFGKDVAYHVCHLESNIRNPVLSEVEQVWKEGA